MWRVSNSPRKRLPTDVYVELVELTFASLLPVAIMTVTAGGVGVLMATRASDPVLALLVVPCVGAALARFALIVAFRRRPADLPLTRAAARRWDRRYAAANLLFALALAALNVRAVATGDGLAHMLTTGLIFGYGSGQVARMSVRPRVCAASLLLAALPTAAAMAVHAHGVDPHDLMAHGAQALLIAVFAVGSLETVAHSYRTTVRHLETKRNLARLARKDALTGLPNRLLLRERLEEELARDDQRVALHFLDLDRFKPVNDKFGHPTGDKLLKLVAERLTGLLRPGDTAARLGGDEFVVVQVGVTHADEARMLAARIVRVIGAPYSVEGREIVIGTSVGIALAPQHGLDLEQLAAHADAALYRAKAEGRSTVAFWDEARPAA